MWPAKPCPRLAPQTPLLLSPPALLPPALYGHRFVVISELKLQDNGLNALAGVVSLCPAVTGDLFKVEGGNSRLSEVRTVAPLTQQTYLALHLKVSKGPSEMDTGLFPSQNPRCFRLATLRRVEVGSQQYKSQQRLGRKFRRMRVGLMSADNRSKSGYQRVAYRGIAIGLPSSGDTRSHLYCSSY